MIFFKVEPGSRATNGARDGIASGRVKETRREGGRRKRKGRVKS